MALCSSWRAAFAPALPILTLLGTGDAARLAAQATMLYPTLAARTHASGLEQPTTMAFIGRNDLLVLEKATGRVRRVVAGTVQSAPVLDLAVNSASERGLLGIAVSPDFRRDDSVYLYWTETTTGADSDVLAETPLLGNRVDRFTWNGSSLTFHSNLIRIRAFQADANQPLRGNHDGGVLAFGRDRKLYVFIGDLGRRGQNQNLADGPFGPNIPDDQFGGPEPDDAHLAGVVLRLNRDGTAPRDNPFFEAGTRRGGEVGANLQKMFSYGHRNGFGMAFDPRSGGLWVQENGDDSFSELNLVRPGMNGGWVQLMGPMARVAQFREIETSTQFFGLQQVRWSPENIAATPAAAMARLVMLPGAHYSDPEFSWKFEVSPGGIGFVDGSGLGPQFEGDLFMGGARATLMDGHLFRFKLSRDRRRIAVDDPRLEDRVADNLDKFDPTESESLLIGRGFGVVTDIETGPNGNLFVTSLSQGVIYEISQAVAPQLVRGMVEEVPGTDDFRLACTGIPLVSRNLELRTLAGHQAELRVVNLGSPMQPRLEVVAARRVDERLEMGELRIGVPGRWEIEAPPGSSAGAWLTARSLTGYFPAGESGTWLLGTTFILAGSGTADSRGRVRFDFTAPNAPGLLGVEFTAQALFVPPGRDPVITNSDCQVLRAP